MPPEEDGGSLLPFNSLPKCFAGSAQWRALCEAVNSPDVVQICRASSVDIISPAEMECLGKAFASTNSFSDFNEERVGNDSTLSPAAHHQRLFAFAFQFIHPFPLHHSPIFTIVLKSRMNKKRSDCFQQLLGEKSDEYSNILCFSKSYYCC